MVGSLTSFTLVCLDYKMRVKILTLLDKEEMKLVKNQHRAPHPV